MFTQFDGTSIWRLVGIKCSKRSDCLARLKILHPQ
uniref:Uncharacterized protein n=1 Tax=Arundo donax TaxID=35708 RepID=A0A0A9AFZ5_ARUDO